MRRTDSTPIGASNSSVSSADGPSAFVASSSETFDYLLDRDLRELRVKFAIWKVLQLFVNVTWQRSGAVGIIIVADSKL